MSQVDQRVAIQLDDQPYAGQLDDQPYAGRLQLGLS